MLKLAELRIDKMLEPLNASFRPDFSWSCVEGSDEDIVFARLSLASSRALLEEGHPDVWDVSLRRRFLSSLSYSGKALSPRTRYYAQLEVRGGKGTFSQVISSFETTLAPSEWKGEWIGVGDSWNGGALAIRKTLDDFAGKKVIRARAYIAGLGYHEVYVNGIKIGDAYLAPGTSAYDKKVLYDTYDLTPYLKGKGDVFGVLLGYGWFGARKLLAQLYLDFSDGSEVEYHSYCNYGWWFAPSPITANSLYSGETYDARIEDNYPGGFSSPSLKEGYNWQWFGSILCQPVAGKLVPERLDPIRILGRYPAFLLQRFSSGDAVYDIRQNIAGFCEISVKGERGSRVILRHAETLKEDGHIDQTNLRSAAATDIYILKGDGVETYHPRFTYHGFRYVEVALEGQVELLSLTGLHLHSDNQRIGAFSCSDESINRLHEMAAITEANNEHSILTDCPQRDERFGWLNDVSTRVFQAVYNYRLDRFFDKVDDDITLVQDKQGRIADTAPYYTGGRPADVTSLSYLLLATESYRFFGDLEVIKKNYLHHRKWVDFLLSHSRDYIMDYYYYADWVACENYPDAKSDGICISSLFLYWHLQTLLEEAAILNKKLDQRNYARLLKGSRKALRANYLHGDHFAEGTQCEDAMALHLGIVPEKQSGKVYAHLRKSILDHDFHLTCGNQGYRHVMAELCEHGDGDLLLAVLKNPRYPGWGFMLANGATTVWERWEKENQATMNSFDHPMFASYDQMFYRYFAGIRLENGSRQAVIEPLIPKGLDWVKCSYQTPKGLLRSEWRKEKGHLIVDLTVPPNLETRVCFKKEILLLDDEAPGRNELRLTPGHHTLTVAL